METKAKKIERLTKALASYESMLNNNQFKFMHEAARQHIADIKQELEELEEEQC